MGKVYRGGTRRLWKNESYSLMSTIQVFGLRKAFVKNSVFHAHLVMNMFGVMNNMELKDYLVILDAHMIFQIVDS